jgi:predicted O-methyltransferase YrrM
VSNQTISLNDELHRYLLDVSLREHPVLQALRAETMTLPESNMQIAPEQGQFMGLLLQLLGASRYLEVGTFTGYSALACALAMPDGEVHALDNSREWTAIAREYWKRADVEQRVHLHLGDARDTLQRFIDDDVPPFDAAFIDADKTGYAGYIECAHRLLRPGGLLMLDNVLWDGAVLDGESADADTRAIRDVNEAMHDDDRWDLSLVPIGDGLTLARKR